MSEETNWVARISLPPNGAWLPVRVDGDPGPQAEQTAAKLLGADARPSQIREHANCLRKAALEAKARADPPLILAALLFLPEVTRLPPAAHIEVQAFGPVRQGSLTLEWFRRSYGKRDNATVGEVEMTEAKLPAGPALRVHRYRQNNPSKRRSTIKKTWSGWSGRRRSATRW